MDVSAAFLSFFEGGASFVDAVLGFYEVRAASAFFAARVSWSENGVYACRACPSGRGAHPATMTPHLATVSTAPSSLHTRSGNAGGGSLCVLPHQSPPLFELARAGKSFADDVGRVLHHGFFSESVPTVAPVLFPPSLAFMMAAADANWQAPPVPGISVVTCAA